MQAIELAIGSVSGQMAAALGARWSGLGTDFARVEAQFDWGRRLRAAAASCAKGPEDLLSLRERLARLVADGADVLMPSASVGGTLAALRTAQAEVAAATETLAGLSGADPVGIVDSERADWAGSLAAHLDGWNAAARYLRDWCAWRGVVHRAAALGIGALVRTMEDGLVAPTEAARVFEVNYAR
ncbi:MAG: hypothetical protein ABSC06_29275, partial [Rhodopila sp.]